MSTKSTNSKPSYTGHSAEYKQESLKLALQVGVAKAARQLGLYQSQLYAWLQRKPSQRLQRREALDGQIKTLFHKHKQRYRAERLLHKMPEWCNLKTIAARLKRQGLIAKAARKFKATTSSKHNLPVFNNLLRQDFSATARSRNEWATLPICGPTKVGYI